MAEATKNELMQEQAEIAAEQKAAEDEKSAKKTTKAKNKATAPGERTAPDEYGPDVVIHVTKDPLNPDLTEIPVCINEYEWIVKRGEKQTVPQAVVDVLTQAGYL